MTSPRPKSGHRRRQSFKFVIPIWAWLSLGTLLVVGAGGFFTAAHLEENDAFCASCHSEPEATYFQRTQANAVDLASYHHGEATRCIDCHSGPGVAGRIGGMMVGAEDLLRWVTNTARQPAPLTVPIRDANCLKCHADTLKPTNFNRHFHAFLPRWQAIDQNAATCVSCHSAHTTDGDPTLTFLEEQRATTICQACHASVGEGGR